MQTPLSLILQIKFSVEKYGVIGCMEVTFRIAKILQNEDCVM